MHKRFVIAALLICVYSCLSGQESLHLGSSGYDYDGPLEWGVSFDKKLTLSPLKKFEGTFAYTAPTFSSERFLPAFVHENPRGYSYLCRLELKVEEKLPLGIWFKVGDNFGIPGGNAHVRFRLFNF